MLRVAMADDTTAATSGCGTKPPSNGGDPDNTDGGDHGYDDQPPDDKCSTVGAGWTGWGGVIATTVVAILATAILAYGLIAFWPYKSDTWNQVRFLGLSFGLSPDAALFIVVLLAGALGGMVHTVRSLSWYFGTAKLRHRWMVMYSTLPVVGGLLALLFYLVLRGGLLTANTTSKEVNVFGFAAIGALVGLASEQAARKLRDVFAAIFTSADKSAKDHSAADNPSKNGNPEGGGGGGNPAGGGGGNPAGGGGGNPAGGGGGNPAGGGGGNPAGGGGSGAPPPGPPQQG
jgi:hypothetical protein